VMRGGKAGKPTSSKTTVVEGKKAWWTELPPSV